MNVKQPAFQPAYPTVMITATTVNASTRVQPSNLAKHVRLWNSGLVPVFIEFGTVGTVASPLLSMPLPPGAVEIFTSVESYIAVATATDTAIVYATAGEGL